MQKIAAGVEAIRTITVDNITKPVKPISVVLTPSTTEPTEGDVTVTVATDSESDLVAIKWLPGKKQLLILQMQVQIFLKQSHSKFLQMEHILFM